MHDYNVHAALYQNFEIHCSLLWDLVLYEEGKYGRQKKMY